MTVTSQVFSHVAQQLNEDRAYREEVRDALIEHYRDAEKEGDATRMEMYAAAIIAVAAGHTARWNPIGLDLR